MVLWWKNRNKMRRIGIIAKMHPHQHRQHRGIHIRTRLQQQCSSSINSSTTTTTNSHSIGSNGNYANWLLIKTPVLQFLVPAIIFYLTIASSYANTITKFEMPPQHMSVLPEDISTTSLSLSSLSSSSSSSLVSSSAASSPLPLAASSSPSDTVVSSPSLTAPSASSAGASALVSSSLTAVSSTAADDVASPFAEPYLDGYETTNVTTQIGTHAYLPCRVKQLGNKSVSWIRVRDGHILTVDRAVFIADQRFLSLKQPDKFWTLQIKYVQARDAGAYECQVSSEPKVSARVHLQVVVPRTEILGDPDRYVKAGSTVILRCIVRGALEPPTFIMWYHGSEQLAADSRRHRIQVDRNLPEVEGDAHSTIGSLIIESAKKRDTGNYTCSPSNSPSVTVMLNIINGESSASAVTSSASVTQAAYNIYYTLILSSLFSLIIFGGHHT